MELDSLLAQRFEWGARESAGLLRLHHVSGLRVSSLVRPRRFSIGQTSSVQRVESLRVGGIQQTRRGGNECDGGAGKHVPGSERGAELQSVRPTERRAVKELPRG